MLLVTPSLTYKYAYDTDDREGFDLNDFMTNSSSFIGMCLLIAFELEDMDLITYNDEVKKDTITAHTKLISILKQYGFYIPSEYDVDVVTGTSDLFAKLENLRS